MNKKIRVLQCFGHLDRGGAETFLMNIYRNINRQKVQFDFVVHGEKKGVFEKEVLEMGGRIFRVPYYKVINHFQYSQAWKRLFDKHKDEWQFVHGHSFITGGIYFKMAQKHNIIAICHSHVTSSGGGLKGFVKKIMRIPIPYISDYCFGCSKAANDALFRRRSTKRNDCTVIKNAIAVRDFEYNAQVRSEMRKMLKMEENFIIGHVGRFEVGKNQGFLVDAFKHIYDRNNKARLLLIGQGRLYKEIEDKVKKLGLEDGVVFMGIRSDITVLLQAMDVFVFPSAFEGLPVALIEAQAAGLKIFTSTAVTEEVKITKDLEFLDLEKGSRYWADCILKYQDGYERQNTYEQIVEAGYDIKENARWLQDFYIHHALEKR